MKLKFYSFVLLYITSISKCKTFIEESLKEKEPSSLLLAVNQIIDEFFSLRYLAVNIINSDQTLYKQSKNVSKVDEFTDELLRKRINSSNVLIRISNSKVKLLPTEDRRRCGVFIIQDFQGFLQIFPMISPENFKFNGFFLVVLVADEIPQIEEMFKIVWSLQIYSFIILYENSSGVVIFKTFMPFSSIHRNDTTPVIINEFKNVKFAKDVKKLYPKKMKNLNDSTIRVATAYDAQPFVIANMLPNGSYHLGGRDIYLVRELAKCLNFKINFTFIGNEGFFFENGSASGPMKELMDGKCEMGVADLWLKANRLKFFDSTAAYIMARLAFIIPPGRELTSFEKLLFPFTMQLWTLISSVFLMGFLVILVVTFQKRQIREFVFGTGVNTPHMNMMIAFVGGTQHKLPKRNFARFLLMMFLIFSLIIRSLYQGSFYKFVHSNKHWREKQSIEEMVDGKFTFYLFDYMFDMFQGTQRIVQRAQVIPFKDKRLYIKKLEDSEFLGALADTHSTVLYNNQLGVNSTRSIICKEMFMTVPSVIYTTKNFYLIDAINEQIENFKSAGLVDHWDTKLLDRNILTIEDAKNPKVIQFRHVYGSFKILISGLIFCVTIFIVEVLFARYKIQFMRIPINHLDKHLTCL